MSRPVYILVALLLCAFAIDAAERRSPIVHVVKRGDTLSEIAARYRVSQERIKRWNKLRSSRIHAGQSLKVGSPVKSGDWYRVRRGDTLSKIARQFAVPVYKLKAINHLDGNVIHVGQKLHLQSTAPPRSASADDRDEEPREYTVRRGDTLSEIALRFDVSLGFLRQLNQLKSDRILIGQKLRLRASRLEEAVHVVQEGETLTEIARRYQVSVSQLQRLNAWSATGFSSAKSSASKTRRARYTSWSAETRCGKLPARTESASITSRSSTASSQTASTQARSSSSTPTRSSHRVPRRRAVRGWPHTWCSAAITSRGSLDCTR